MAEKFDPSKIDWSKFFPKSDAGNNEFPDLFTDTRQNFGDRVFRTTEPDDAERRRQQQYYEEHWPEYRNRAVENLRESLEKSKVTKRITLKDRRILELREGTYNNADDIHTREHESYSVPALAIGKEEHSDFRIACFADKPYEPVGYYFIRRYPEDDEYNTKPAQGDETIVAESKLVYVAPNQRGQHFGSVLMALASLEAIDDPRVHILRKQVANEKIESILKKLGFEPSGKKTTYGYTDYSLDLRENRESAREIFQKYLDQYTQTNEG